MKLTPCIHHVDHVDNCCPCVLSNQLDTVVVQLAEMTAQRDRAEVDGEGARLDLRAKTQEYDWLVKTADEYKEKLAAAQLEIVELRRVLKDAYDAYCAPRDDEVEAALITTTIAAPLIELLRDLDSYLKSSKLLKENNELIERLAPWLPDTSKK